MGHQARPQLRAQYKVKRAHSKFNVQNSQCKELVVQQQGSGDAGDQVALCLGESWIHADAATMDGLDCGQGNAPAPEHVAGEGAGPASPLPGGRVYGILGFTLGDEAARHIGAPGSNVEAPVGSGDAEGFELTIEGS